MTRLSDGEWDVLTVLWEREGAALRELVETLFETKRWSQKTVLTYLTRMEAKGLVEIDKDVSPRRYMAAVSREECRAQERRSFLDRVYKGAAGELVAAFLKEEPISAEERERLRRLLDDMEV